LLRGILFAVITLSVMPRKRDVTLASFNKKSPSATAEGLKAKKTAMKKANSQTQESSLLDSEQVSWLRIIRRNAFSFQLEQWLYVSLSSLTVGASLRRIFTGFHNSLLFIEL